MNVKRTIEFHKPPDYDSAALKAFNWVNETGGTLLFMLPRDRFRSLEYFKEHKAELAKPSADKKVHIEVTYGDSFLMWGPRLAAVGVDDLGMRRIERDLSKRSVCCPVSELRSFARFPDKHPRWTQQYDLDASSEEI